MHTIHIIADNKVHTAFEAALTTQQDADSHEVFLLQDTLNIGPLQQEEHTFAAVRTAFQNLITNQTMPLPIDDLERLMQLSTRLSNGEQAQFCFWMGANAADVCAYYWLLHYLKKHSGKLSVINIAGLPFLNEANQLFYPELIEQLPTKELVKALKLKRQISLSEWETDQETWRQLREENASIRLLTEGRNLKSVAMDYFDSGLISLCKENSKRRSTILQQARQQFKFQVSETFLQYRLRILEEQGSIQIHQNKVSMTEEGQKDIDKY